MDAEILILLQAGVPLLPQAFPLLLPRSPPSLSLQGLGLQDGRRVSGFARHGN